MKSVAVFMCLFIFCSSITAQKVNTDGILGKWESVKNNLIVEVYKVHTDYRARVIWFKNTNEIARPSNTWVDEKNPDKRLRNRKRLGMEVLSNLVFNIKNNRWEEGQIYDCTTGRTWNSSAWITNQGLLKVRGFWHFEFIGQTMVFKRI